MTEEYEVRSGTVQLGHVKVCDWDKIHLLFDAQSALRGTLGIIGFEMQEPELDLDRLAALAKSLLRGTERVAELTPDD